MKKPKIVFFGTPEPAKVVLESLIKSGFEIVAVVTKPDRKRSRGNKLEPTPVKKLAIKNSLDVIEPEKSNEILESINKYNADVAVVVAYGKILPVQVLENFRFGCINVHYSLLPKWRGAAPVERALLNGDETTGVCIMKMDEGLDTGKIYASRQVDISDQDTTSSLFDSLNAIACDLLRIVLDDIESQEPYDQEGEHTYAQKLDKTDFEFSTNSSAIEVDRKIRAGSNVKGAWTIANGEVFRIIKAKLDRSQSIAENVGQISEAGILFLNDGVIEIEEIQVPSKPVMKFNDWKNGIDKSIFPIKIGL